MEAVSRFNVPYAVMNDDSKLGSLDQGVQHRARLGGRCMLRGNASSKSIHFKTRYKPQ